ncbi:MAG: nicotinate (nicotinamide) nucleotide adenylyltransferase [Spirochaetaceae bacterium]|nr:MAG: nicotinate (nicotinamide) nucleotide adenylyltransferase [Spirochaetaceae bacterium]
MLSTKRMARNPVMKAHNSTDVAIFGGSFDPVHVGHLAIAQAALDLELCKHVIWVPAARNPLKKRRPFANDSQRLEMLRLATLGCPDFSISEVELQRSGRSYTLQTVNQLRNAGTIGGSVSLLLGDDQLEKMTSWFDWEILLSQCCLLVYQRIYSEAERLQSAIQSLSTACLNAGVDARIKLVEMQPISVSSTGVRQMIASLGQDGNSSDLLFTKLGQMLPPNVFEYIINRNLYGGNR